MYLYYLVNVKSVNQRRGQGKSSDGGRKTESVCVRERPRGLSSRYLWNVASNLGQAAGESRWAVQVSSLTHSPIHTHTHIRSSLPLTVSKTLTHLFSFCHSLSCVLCSLYPILPEPHTLFLTLVLNILSQCDITVCVASFCRVNVTLYDSGRLWTTDYVEFTVRVTYYFTGLVRTGHMMPKCLHIATRLSGFSDKLLLLWYYWPMLIYYRLIPVVQSEDIHSPATLLGAPV